MCCARNTKLQSSTEICNCFSPHIICFIFCLSFDTGPDLNQELDSRVPPIVLDPRHYHGSFCQGKDETDSNCWTSPSGAAFKIRGKTYLKDNTKVGIC